MPSCNHYPYGRVDLLNIHKPHIVMSNLESICVYCGSSPGLSPIYSEAARELGKEMAERDISLVYGGGSLGLMGATAKSCLDHGGHVVGIIPEFLTAKEKLLETQETYVVPDMHERKRKMFERADAFVALPGGIGTLEELVEQMTWAQLGRHRKPILLLNINNFWKPLLVLLAHMRQAGFIRPQAEIRYLVAEKVEDVIPMLQTAIERHADPLAEARAATLIEERL